MKPVKNTPQAILPFFSFAIMITTYVIIAREPKMRTNSFLGVLQQKCGRQNRCRVCKIREGLNRAEFLSDAITFRLSYGQRNDPLVTT